MGSKVNFTAGRLDAFKCEHGKQQSIYWDAKTPGLGLRVTSAGTKSFIFETRLHGKTLRITIGSALTYDIDKAQDIASRYKVLTNDGIDPRQQRAEKRTAAESKIVEEEARRVVAAITVEDAWNDYLTDMRTKWSVRHYVNHTVLANPGGIKRTRGRRHGEGEYTLPGSIFPLLSIPLFNLNSAEVKAWLQREVNRGGTQAESAYRKMRAFVNWCDSSEKYAGIVPSGAFIHPSVVCIVPKVKPKDDCLQREQLQNWFSAVKKINNPVISAYLQTLLLTGSRRNELAPLKWEDVDFRWKSMTIRDKVEGERTIPLTPYVALLLTDLKRRNETPPNIRYLNKSATEGDQWKPSPYVFASKSAASGHITEPRIAHNHALKVAGIDDLTIHGLRRSFGTLCEWVEVPVGISAQIMGHKPSAIAEKHYRRRPIDLLRRWHERIEAWILDQAGINFDFGGAKLAREMNVE